MLVANRMTLNPQTIGPEAMLATAFEKMAIGQFRRLPVVERGMLVGILTDRDLRSHEGSLRTTSVGTAMTDKPLTLSPYATVELAAQLMIKNKISGMPVVDQGALVGVITTTDVMRAFLEVMGADEEDSLRIDVAGDQGHDLGAAFAVVREAGGDVLAVGAYRDAIQGRPVFYLRMHGRKAEPFSSTLEKRGFSIVGTHR